MTGPGLRLFLLLIFIAVCSFTIFNTCFSVKPKEKPKKELITEICLTPYSPSVLDVIDRLSKHYAFCVMHFVSPDKFSTKDFWWHYKKYTSAKIDLMVVFDIELEIESPIELEIESPLEIKKHALEFKKSLSFLEEDKKYEQN